MAFATRRRRAIATAAILLAGSLGCSSDGGGGGGEPDGGDGGVEPADLYGIRVGARWVYANTDYTASGGPQKTDLIKEIVGCEEITFIDCDTGQERTHNTYVQETTGGNISATNPREEERRLYMILTDEGLVRVRQDFIYDDVLDHFVTYSPYFMRVPGGPYSDGRQWEFAHKRCEYDPAGTELGVTERRYLHEVRDADERASVAAGEFETVHFQRTDLGDGDVKEFWYAAGIGKVMEEGYVVSGFLVSDELLEEFRAGDRTCE